MKPRYPILALCLLLAIGAHAQHVFNVRNTLHSGCSFSTSIKPYDNKYFCTSVCLDSSNYAGGGEWYAYYGINFAVLDTLGNIVRDTVYEELYSNALLAWVNNLVIQPDSTFVIGAIGESSSSDYAAIIQFDNLGHEIGLHDC